MKNIILIAFFAHIFFSCKHTEPIANGTNTNEQSAYLSDVLVNDDFDDIFNVLDVFIHENNMSLVVSYGGGCGTHEFQLAGLSGVVKTFPPKRDVQLLHNGNNDLCKMLITDTITFNIENLSNDKKPGSEIILNLKGWDTPISYTYVKP
jgi:hypothetical protein